MPVMGGLFASGAASPEGLGRLTCLEERSEIGGEVVDGAWRMIGQLLYAVAHPCQAVVGETLEQLAEGVSHPLGIAELDKRLLRGLGRHGHVCDLVAGGFEIGRAHV